MIDACPLSPQELLRLRDHDPVVQRYRALFALVDWSAVPPRTATRPWPGSEPHPPSAYIKALLIKLCEHKDAITQLRAFLVDHPLLVLELGFRPVPDAQALYGFDRERTVPCARWLRHWQQQLDNGLLSRLLSQTVAALRAALPKVGETLAIDVKHIFAWVTQNNPKAYVTERFNPERQPTGDPDCRLGVKKSSNQVQADGAVKEKKQYLWGYGSGVAAATDPHYGDVVLAEYTRPFNEADLTSYHPLYDRAVVALGRRPTTVTADAAFDAWHIYETAAPEGIAAIPLNLRGHPAPQRQPDGTPLCPTGRPMRPAGAFTHTEGYRAQEFRCPLLHPQPTGQTCAHEQFARGSGCVKYINIERGGLRRVLLDRAAAPYKDIYRQRTCTERINAQATDLGIERPKVRNAASVRTLNTLTYILINLRALLRVRAAKPHPPA